MGTPREMLDHERAMQERGAMLESLNEKLRGLIARTQLDMRYRHRPAELFAEKISFMATHCVRVLDFGRSSRHLFESFRRDQIVTSDINVFEGYPDVLDDICDIRALPFESFDGIICNAIFEHVYDPWSAINNVHRLLTPGGYVFFYAPFLYPYHAPRDLKYQDFYRYTRDGLAYLFRDFSEVTLYPVRGRLSTVLNLLPFWKRLVERNFAHRVNALLDKMVPRDTGLQASGYYVWARRGAAGSVS